WLDSRTAPAPGAGPPGRDPRRPGRGHADSAVDLGSSLPVAGAADQRPAPGAGCAAELRRLAGPRRGRGLRPAAAVGTAAGCADGELLEAPARIVTMLRWA